MTLDCPDCGPVSPEVQWEACKVASGQSHLLRASCPECGKWLKWLPQTEENKKLARPVPPPGPSLFDLIDRLP